MNRLKKITSQFFLLTVLLCNAACAADGADFPVVPASKNVPKFRVETVAANLEIVVNRFRAGRTNIFDRTTGKSARYRKR